MTSNGDEKNSRRIAVRAANESNVSGVSIGVEERDVQIDAQCKSNISGIEIGHQDAATPPRRWWLVLVVVPLVAALIGAVGAIISAFINKSPATAVSATATSSHPQPESSASAIRPSSLHPAVPGSHDF
jgi:hypothetical protein